MLSFKEFVQSTNESIMDKYLNKKLIGTKHYQDRLTDRSNDQKALKHIFRKFVDHLTANDYGDHSKFLVYSKKFNQAVAFEYKKNKSNLIATTIFPVGDKYANPSTKLINVEVYSPEFINYVNEFINEEQRIEYPLSEVIFEGVEFYFLNGNLHNLPFTEFIEVE